MKTLSKLLAMSLLIGCFSLNVSAQSNLMERTVSKKILLQGESKKYTSLNEYNLYVLDLKTKLYFYFASNCDDRMTVYNPVMITPMIIQNEGGTVTTVWTGSPADIHNPGDIKLQADETWLSKPNTYLTFKYECNAYYPINLKNDIYQIYTGKYKVYTKSAMAKLMLSYTQYKAL
ncbi:MAG: hypothetical protein M3O71_10055 [Bacteroidota bacterium]|nr:hypothetical protein [Bacteroidota bacterium]